jgi:CBS domain-containing protein
MRIGDLCSRDVHPVTAEEPVLDAVREMHRRHVGAVVVVDRPGTSARPLGIVTDRDVMRAEIMQRAVVFTLPVGAVMSVDLLTLRESSELTDAIELMRRRGVRRAPVVDPAGVLLGIVTLDDLLPAVAGQLDALARLLGRQARHEH